MDKSENKHFSGAINQEISRIALLLYSRIIVNGKRKTFLLIPTSSATKCLTTLGGRKERGRETDIECIIREAKQESRGILNYEKIPEIFNSKIFTKITHKDCIYFSSQIPYDEMKNISLEFKNAKQVDHEVDEIDDLNLYDIDKLILDLNSVNSIHKYHPFFADMFLSIGYDFLKKISCNKESKKLGIEGKIYKKISLIPEYVSLQTELIIGAPNLSPPCS